MSSPNQVRVTCVCGMSSSHQCTADWNVPNVADSAWHAVWLHGDWPAITRPMSTAERNLAADAVARHSRRLALLDGNFAHTEPVNLRWWLAA